jgi:hypothetical protein
VRDSLLRLMIFSVTTEIVLCTDIMGTNTN